MRLNSLKEQLYYVNRSKVLCDNQTPLMQLGLCKPADTVQETAAIYDCYIDSIPNSCKSHNTDLARMHTRRYMGNMLAACRNSRTLKICGDKMYMTALDTYTGKYTEIECSRWRIFR